MNVPCGLIQDLLPLYYDEVCSQESRSLVEEHLAECPACRQRLADLSAPLPTPEEKEETAALKEVQTTWKKTRRRARWKGVAIALAAIFLAVCPLWLTIHKGTDIPTEDIQISQACQLEDGTVVFLSTLMTGRAWIRCWWKKQTTDRCILPPSERCWNRGARRNTDCTTPILRSVSHRTPRRSIRMRTTIWEETYRPSMWGHRKTASSSGRRERTFPRQALPWRP